MTVSERIPHEAWKRGTAMRLWLGRTYGTTAFRPKQQRAKRRASAVCWLALCGLRKVSRQTYPCR